MMVISFQTLLIADVDCIFAMSLVIVWLNYPQMCQLIEVNILFNRYIFPQTIWPYVSIFWMHFLFVFFCTLVMDNVGIFLYIFELFNPILHTFY